MIKESIRFARQKIYRQIHLKSAKFSSDWRDTNICSEAGDL